MLSIGVDGDAPVQVKLAYLVFPFVELEVLTQVPVVGVRLQFVMSAPLSGSYTEVIAVN